MVFVRVSIEYFFATDVPALAAGQGRLGGVRLGLRVFVRTILMFRVSGAAELRRVGLVVGLDRRGRDRRLVLGQQLLEDLVDADAEEDVLERLAGLGQERLERGGGLELLLLGGLERLLDLRVGDLDVRACAPRPGTSRP